MVQAVSNRPLTVETRLRYQVIPCKICGQSGIGTGFSPDPSVFRCSLFLLTLQTHLVCSSVTSLDSKQEGKVFWEESSYHRHLIIIV